MAEKINLCNSGKEDKPTQKWQRR